MCGIVATAGFRTTPEAIEKAAAALAHRGPDNFGSWHSSMGDVWFAHRRLSIVDLSERGNQPMSDENGKSRLIANGEIYNYPQLRAALEGRGHRFTSDCDNEAIVHAYAEWGEDLANRLDGMFAFVIWDEDRRRIIAGRDRIGIKPLYYAETRGGLAVASEAGALLPLLDPRPEIDPQALAFILTLGYVPAPRSIWRGIRKLDAGHVLVWDAKTGVSLRKYWEPPRELKSADENAADWPELLKRVLGDHLMADVPVGLFLSGGLDSSTIAAGLAELGADIEAITISFPDNPLNEGNSAKETADFLNIPHRIQPLSVDDVDDLLRRVTAAADEPQGYGALLTMYQVSEAAARDYKVVLAGDGGDEVFGGYRWYRDLDGDGGARARLTRRALRPLVRRNASPRVRARAMDAFAGCSALHRHAWRLFPRFLPEEAEALLAPMGLRFGDDELLAPLRRHFEPALPLKRALQRMDLMTFNSDSILAKVDRMSMAHSLEVRVPMLDRRVVEWGLTLPPDPKGSNNDASHESKSVLRGYLRGRVPDSVLQRPKQGFSLPVMADYDWGRAIDVIRRGPWVRDGLWTKDWSRFVEPGIPNREGRIQAMLMLTRWAEAWLSH